MRRALTLLAVVSILPACGGGGGGGDGAAIQSGGTQTYNDPGIETFPDEGNTHVAVGTVISYNTDPPTSGNHYPFPQQGGFYQNPIQPGFLVHSMEHGGVILYYNPAAITGPQTDALKALAQAHQGVFAQVVCVPRDDATYPIILTAWTHRLRLTAYDQGRIDNFLSLFLGQGPESPWGDPTSSNVTLTTTFNQVSLLEVTDDARPGSMTSNNGMGFPAEGTTFSIELQASAASALADRQMVRIVSAPDILATAIYDASTGIMTFSVGSTTLTSASAPTGSFHTVTFSIDGAGMAAWAVDGSPTASVSFGNPTVSMELDANYASGSGGAPTFSFRNLVVTNVVTGS